MMQANGGKLCIGWLHGLGVPALHSKVPCTFSVCNPGLFDETRLSTLCRDDLAFDFRSSPDGSADDPEVGRRNIVNSTRTDEGHFKTESVMLPDASESGGSHKTGCESQRTSSEADPTGNPDTQEDKSLLPVASMRGPVASESRGELLQCEDGVSALEDLLRHYWLLRDSEEEIQKTKSRREPTYNETFNWLLKKSFSDQSASFESSSSAEGDDKDEIRFERDDTDSLASLSTISEEDPEEISSADSSNQIDALFGDPDLQDFHRFYQHSRPSFEISTKLDGSFENKLSSSRDFTDSWENLEDGGEEGGGKPASDSEEDCAVPPPLSADDTFARIFSRHVTDTCPSFSPGSVSQESDVEDDDKSCDPGTADDPKDTEANSQANHQGEYTISDTRVHLNLIACQDDLQQTDDCLDELIQNGSVAGKENSGADLVAGRSSFVSSPTSWYTVSDVFDSQSFEIAEIADNVTAAGDIAMSAAYAKCTAIYRCVATDSSDTDSPSTSVSVSTKVTAVDPVAALSRAASRVASLAAAKACPVISARSQGNLEISLTASCSLSPPRGDVDSIPADEVGDVNVVIDADLRQAFDTVDNADLRQAFDTIDNAHARGDVDNIPTDGVDDVNDVTDADLRQAFDTVDNAEPRCCNIEADLSDQKSRFISMIDSATETINSVADAAVQSDMASFLNTENPFAASTQIWNSTRKDTLTGEDDTLEDIVFAQNSVESGDNFSCQIAVPSTKISEGSKSSGYGSRSNSDDLLDDYEITGVAVKEFPKFKTPMPQNTDTSKEIEKSGQELPTRAIEVSCSDQEERRNTGKGQDTLIWNDRSNENRISGQEPLLENKPTNNNNNSDKTVNGDNLNFVNRNDTVIHTDGRNDARVAIDTDLRQAFDTVDHVDLRQAFDNAELGCCNIKADLSDQKIQTEGVVSNDNQTDNCRVVSATEDKMRYKNREFIGFKSPTVASRDYGRRRDTSSVSRPVIRSQSLLLETDIDTLEHRRTIVARNCSTLSVGEDVTSRTSLRSAESQNQRRPNKSRDYFSWDSSSNSSFDLISKEALEFMLCYDDTSSPRYFAKKRSNQGSNYYSHDGGYYNSEPNLKPNANQRNTSSRNSNDINIGKDSILGARKKPDKLSLETRDERTLHKDSVDRMRSRVKAGHDHHHDDETRNTIERYESSPSLRRRSLSILTTPSSGRRKKSDVNPDTECRPEMEKRSTRPVNSSFENLVDSLLGITGVMSMETAARCGSNPPFVSSKGGAKPKGRPHSSNNPIPPPNERRTFAKPSPSENETTGDQGRTSSSLPPLVPLSVPPYLTQTTPTTRSLPVVRKHEHFRKAKHIFLKCGFCIEGNGTSNPAKGKAPLAMRKNSNGADKKQ